MIADEFIQNTISDVDDESESSEPTITKKKKTTKKTRQIKSKSKSTQVASNTEESDEEPNEEDNLDPLLLDDQEEVGVAEDLTWTSYIPDEATKLRSHKYVNNTPKFKVAPDKIGPIVPPGVDTELDYFKLFWDDEILNKFVDSTNAYANAKKIEFWRNIDIFAIYKFFAVIFYMGICQLPSRDTYWKKDGKYNSGYVSQIMTNRQFNRILEAFHFEKTHEVSDEERKIKNKQDPFWSVSKFFAILASNCQKYYQCGHFVDIDEMTVPFKGRMKAVCYNPHKPNKWHIKFFCLNDADTGYLSNFIPYAGRDETRPEGVSATEFPVQILTNPVQYHNKSHIMFTDNWYTSINMGKHLLNKGIHFAGTIKLTRKGLPKNDPGTENMFFKKKSAPRGSILASLVVICGLTMFFTSWMDNKSVNLLSSYATEWTPIERRGKDKQKNYQLLQLKRPTIIGDYNHGMGGTDKHDQMNGYYRTTIKTLAWQPRIYTHFLMSAATNAWILKRQKDGLSNEEYSLLDFIDNLIDQLSNAGKIEQNEPELEEIEAKIDAHDLNSNKVEDWLNEAPYIKSRLDTKNHWPMCTNNTDRRRCIICSSRMSSFCGKCNQFLCIGPNDSCFVKFHTQKKFL